VKVVAWFSELSSGDVAVAGGKGAYLGELTRAGFTVPPGFVVLCDAYRAFLEAGLQTGIEALLSNEYSDLAWIQKVAEDIKRLFETSEVSAEIAAPVRSAYRELGGGPVAVRSSCTAEDLADASFAGQQSTFLNVRGEQNVVHSVKACWASLFEPQAIDYRRRRGYAHLDVSMAVVVQEMVQSDRAGVAFTVHPITGDTDKAIVEAAWGLGEAVVSGQVTPDCYVVDKPSFSEEETSIETQERELKMNASGVTGEDNNVWLPVPAARARARKLSPEELRAVVELAMRAEAHYGCPQDIEWAEEGGQFYLVQSRPVTTVP